MKTANSILREMFPDRAALHAKAMWEAIAFHMAAVADGVDSKTAAYIALVLFHSKGVEASYVSRGVLGMMGL